jgi:hypothetical protein
LSKVSGFTYASELSSAEASRIAQACDGIPLAIRWALARSESASEALIVAEGITGSGRHGEELLEFCFRRVFDKMPGPEKAVLYVLSLFQRPMPQEVILKGANLPHFRLVDATDDLLADALIQRLFDPERNDYCYTLLPIARAFVYSEVQSQPQLEEHIRRTLADWFEGKDVSDPKNDELYVRRVKEKARWNLRFLTWRKVLNEEMMLSQQRISTPKLFNATLGAGKQPDFMASFRDIN